MTSPLFLLAMDFKCCGCCLLSDSNILVFHLILFCSYQEAIEDITKRMGAGMAKFICKEVGNPVQSAYSRNSFHCLLNA